MTKHYKKKFTAKEYMAQRKKQLIEYRTLIFERCALNKKIRTLQNDMNSLDKFILVGLED